MANISRDVSHTLYLTQNVVVANASTLPIYGSVEKADNFFAMLLEGESWCFLNRDKRVKCLVSATKLVDQLNYSGEVVSADQPLQFPRGTDTTVPGAIEEATYWLALALSKGVDPDTERDNAFMKTQAFGNLRTEYDRSSPPVHIINGIPSPRAWALLRPFLVEDRGLNLRRVS